ncbi:MAG: HAD family hydrolase [archaeon]|nr:HAD family hydrolase [archaeon]MCP8314357.1 HAD family hydrolase [archaeon]
MKLKSVLFDFDGTIVDLDFKYAESRVAIIKALKELDFDTLNFSLQDTAQTILEKVEKQIMEKSMNIKLSEIKDKIWSIIDEFEMEAVNASELLKETKSILRLLSEKGIKKGLVTNSGRKAVQLALIKHELEHGFDVIVTRDEVDRLKPYGDGIRLALRMINVPIENAIYVGDSINDVLAAKDANVYSIAINRWPHYIEKLRKSSPDYIVNSLGETMNLLKRLID